MREAFLRKAEKDGPTADGGPLAVARPLYAAFPGFLHAGFAPGPGLPSMSVVSDAAPGKRFAVALGKGTLKTGKGTLRGLGAPLRASRLSDD
jgi:hypothetical protein